ncbi:hypothetical protein WJX81_002727 [Elliptochloris bilobata]|uniref:Tudor domain-containing protein n=1 Tax=Elliptochloris bilobata TaxID=381761 RepID=A0AAW1QKD6_9CHLO
MEFQQCEPFLVIGRADEPFSGCCEGCIGCDCQATGLGRVAKRVFRLLSESSDGGASNSGTGSQPPSGSAPSSPWAALSEPSSAGAASQATGSQLVRAYDGAAAADASSMPRSFAGAGATPLLAGEARLRPARRAAVRGALARSSGDSRLPFVAGSTAAEKASNARAMASAAWAEVRSKAERAAALVAEARSMAASEARPVKRGRTMRLNHYVGPPAHVLVGARISVFWPDDDAFYKGRILEVLGGEGECRVLYDDDMEERLTLPRERFRWLAPRARSAGATPELYAEMARLGADNSPPEPPLPPAVPASVAPPPGTAAVGTRVSVFCGATSRWCPGLVLAHRLGLHQVLYDDGEDEWLDLRCEAARALPPAAVSAGLPTGLDTPCGSAAIGWRVAVYWRGGTAFYNADIAAYNPGTGRHLVVYDDGAEETLDLGSKVVPGPEEDPLVAACAPKDLPRPLIGTGSTGGAEANSPGHSLGVDSEESQQTAATLTLTARPPPLTVSMLGPTAGSLLGTPKSAERRRSVPWRAAPRAPPPQEQAPVALATGIHEGRLTPLPQSSMPPDTLQALLEEMEGLPPLEGAMAGAACLDW